MLIPDPDPAEKPTQEQKDAAARERIADQVALGLIGELFGRHEQAATLDRQRVQAALEEAARRAIDEWLRRPK